MREKPTNRKTSKVKLIFLYFIKRLSREGFKSLSIPVLSMIIVLLINVLAGVKTRMEEEYEYTMQHLKIAIEVSDGDGTTVDGLLIGAKYIDIFINPDNPYSLYDFVETPELKRTLDITNEEESGSDIRLISINNPLAIHAIDQTFADLNNRIEIEILENRYIEYFDEFDETLFLQNRFIGNSEKFEEHDGAVILDKDELTEIIACFISEDILEFVNEDGFLPLVTMAFRGPVTRSNEHFLEVRGIIHGIDENLVLISDSTMNDILINSDVSMRTGYSNIEFFYGYIISDTPDTIELNSNFDVEDNDKVDIDTDLEDDQNNDFIDDETDTENNDISPTDKFVIRTSWREFPSGRRIHGVGYGLSFLTVFEITGSVIGINNIEIIDDILINDEFEITFFDSYDESIFNLDLDFDPESIQPALISEDMLILAENNELKLNIKSRNLITSKAVDAEFEVVGIITGSVESTIFTSFHYVNYLGNKSDASPIYTEVMRTTLTNNRDLIEFKKEALKSFSRVGIFYNPDSHALTIYDAEFFDRTEAAMQAIFFIDIATPFVYFLSICIGFIASFLLTRRRIPEFALMRSVGVGRGHIFFGALSEQTVLCTFGAFLGVLIYVIAWDYDAYINQTIIFIGCYLLGTLFTIFKATGSDVLSILRKKE